MPITASLRSLGNSSLPPRKLAWAAACLALLTFASPLAAKTYATGEAAFAVKAYAQAAALWRKEAKAGSAHAFFQLGLLADLGLGMEHDAKAAFAYYRAAADQGLPEAALNVGVMLDAGSGVQKDNLAASTWYAKAALGGNQRAAYNLGLLYQGGIGVPANLDLAALWLGRAATLPAAKAALQRLLSSAAPRPTATGSLMPTALSAKVRYVDGVPRGEFVWTAPPGPESALFCLQVFVPDAASQPVVSIVTEASAIATPLSGDPVAWQVTRIDQNTGQYWASGWQPVGGSKAPVIRGLVTIAVNAGDAHAASAANALASTLQTNGLIVHVALNVVPGGSSQIDYRFAPDAELARTLAGFLPGFASVPVVLSPDLNTGPGEVLVTLVFAP